MKQAISSKKFTSYIVLRNSLRNCLRNSEKGQAAIEYVLVLILVVTMLSSLKGVFKSLDDFMYSYMGAYVSCLMEYGELPARCVEAAELKQNQGGGSSGGKVCNSKFGGFTLADGFRENSSRPGSGSSKNRNSSQSANSAASVQNKTTSPIKSSGSSLKDSDLNSGSASNRNSSSSYANGRIKRSSNFDGTGTADNGSESADSKTRVLEDEQVFASGRGSGGIRSTNVVYERKRYKAITGKLAEDLNNKTKLNRAPTSRTLQNIEEGVRIGPRKSVFVPPEIKAAKVSEDDNSGFQFGNLIKWLMIAGMGITLFLFFGSQIMSFMNSQEK